MEGARRATSADLPELERLVAAAVAEYADLKGGDVWQRREARPEPYGPSLAAQVASEAALVVVLFAVGEWLEGRAVARARRELESLVTLAPQTARLRSGDGRSTPIEPRGFDHLAGRDR